MSPHYVRDVCTVSVCGQPKTIMDFDEDTDAQKLAVLEQLHYPCPGEPALAKKAASLIRAAGMQCEEQANRGMDHGVWTPLSVVFPDASIPVVSISVCRGFDAKQ